MMGNCINCSAPLPPNSIQCEYCHSRNDTDLRGIHKFTTHEIESERICPRCNTSLRTIDLKIEGKFLIERCDDCLGLFFDLGELEALLEASVKNVFVIKKSRIDNINKIMRNNDYGITYIKCPVCSDLMNRVNFGSGAKSGVIIDRCNQHGIWLDGGELRHLLEWMKAGGKLLHNKITDKKTKKRDLEQKKELNYISFKAGKTDDILNSLGHTIQKKDPDLFSVIKRAFRLFT